MRSQVPPGQEKSTHVLGMNEPRQSDGQCVKWRLEIYTGRIARDPAPVSMLAATLVYPKPGLPPQQSKGLCALMADERIRDGTA